MTRLILLMTVALLGAAVPSAAMVAAQSHPPGGEGGYSTGSVHVGGSSSRYRARGWTNHAGFGVGKRGVEPAGFEARPGSAGDDGGPPPAGPIGPADCGDGPPVLPAWDKIVPLFHITTNPNGQGVVSDTTHFELDGEFDGSVYQERLAVPYHTEPAYDATNTFVGCALQPTPTVTIRVSFWPVAYTWDYGDGTALRRYPCGSPNVASPCNFGIQRDEVEIQHRYEVSSASVTDHNFMVVASVEFAMGIGPDNDDMNQVQTIIPSLIDRAWLHYPVREIQSILIG